MAWNKLAEICANLLFKGRKVYVEEDYQRELGQVRMELREKQLKS